MLGPVHRPLASVPSPVHGLHAVMDLEGRIPRALEALGPLAGRNVAIIDAPGTPWLDRLRDAGVTPLVVAPDRPLTLPVEDGSLDAVVALWTAFRGVDPVELAEVDRALAVDGRLLVVHDYGRDDVAGLGDPAAPEYGTWSRRDGPFLRDAGFRIRVLHCYWTFTSLEVARTMLASFGEPGEALGTGLKRPRIAWNVAVYHRRRGGAPPEAAPSPV